MLDPASGLVGEGQEDISKWDLSFQSNLHEIHISACISF